MQRDERKAKVEQIEKQRVQMKVDQKMLSVVSPDGSQPQQGPVLDMKQLRRIHIALAGVQRGANLQIGRTALFALFGGGGGYALLLVAESLGQRLPSWSPLISAALFAGAGFATCRFKSYLEELYTLLSQVIPTQRDQYKAVQEAAERGTWGEFADALLDWLDAERRCLEPRTPTAVDIAKRGFLSKQ